MKKTLFLLSLAFIYGTLLQAQNWSQIVKAVANDRAAADEYGYSEAISGDFAIVGAYRNDADVVGGNPLNDAGAAYILKNIGNDKWVQQQKLVSPDRAANDFFGYSVSISGDFVVVGAHQEDDDKVGANPMVDAGSAYVFSKSAGWGMNKKIIAPNRGAGDAFFNSQGRTFYYRIVLSMNGSKNIHLNGNKFISDRTGNPGALVEVISPASKIYYHLRFSCGCKKGENANTANFSFP
ncbi:MAG: FG-GAP repeat protein [Flavobacteriales bacterium]